MNMQVMTQIGIRTVIDFIRVKSSVNSPRSSGYIGKKSVSFRIIEIN